MLESCLRAGRLGGEVPKGRIVWGSEGESGCSGGLFRGSFEQSNDSSGKVGVFQSQGALTLWPQVGCLLEGRDSCDPSKEWLFGVATGSWSINPTWKSEHLVSLSSLWLDNMILLICGVFCLRDWALRLEYHQKLTDIFFFPTSCCCRTTFPRVLAREVILNCPFLPPFFAHLSNSKKKI